MSIVQIVDGELVYPRNLNEIQKKIKQLEKEYKKLRGRARDCRREIKNQVIFLRVLRSEKKKRDDEERDNQIVKLREQKKTFREIAEIVGHDQSFVREVYHSRTNHQFVNWRKWKDEE